MKARWREEASPHLTPHKATRLARMLDKILWLLLRRRLFDRMRSDRCNRWVHHHLPLLAVFLSLRLTVAQVMMTDSVGLRRPRYHPPHDRDARPRSRRHHSDSPLPR